MRFPPMLQLASATMFALCVSSAHAKLPALSDEAKAKATDTAARAAWSDKVGAFKLCQTIDKVAARYQAGPKAQAGATAAAATPVATPPCTDPGPFVMVEAPKPLEASGAHSPPGNAVGAPSNQATEAEMKGGIKK